MKKLQVSHKEELRGMEKKSKDVVIFDFLDSQDYQDRLEKHLVDYRTSPEFENLVEDRSIGYFDKGYDRTLSFMKKYPNLDIDVFLQGLVPPTPLHPNISGIPTEDGVVSVRVNTRDATSKVGEKEMGV
ncbi:hypothetical protein ACH5RR_018300 [Cinchona calisaya]|uniref:Uncharacterized protein n=1 Tax=Cinchona calisaya TaxID=153742 RepID=A0ABD2ZMQ5_9GENT